MAGNPQWKVDIDICGDEDVTFARATLTGHHMVLVGRGISRTRTCASADRLTGDDAAAVGAALQDLARQLAGAPRRPHTPAAHLTAPRAPHRKAREHRPA